MTDLEIAQKAQMLPIREVAKKLNISEDDLDPYGKYKAKLPLHLINAEKMKNSKLVLVTAITPTPAGEGKTTVSIGLTEGLNKIGKKAIAVLREPSLGPVFGIKGGAAGGGYSQVVPMEDINLHFTGDFSAIEKANNLLAAVIDNNIQSKTHSIGIDPRTVVWKRVMDMNDRALRHIVVGLGGATHGVPREDGFNITPASEIMAILCLAESFSDLKKRIGNIYVGKKFDGTPVFARDLKVVGAMALLLKEAIKPNLVQTLENNPAILHGGPFASIAQGTNTVLATKMGLSLSDYVITEAGFGADLGAEKFLNIKCTSAGLAPDAVVIVATIRALRHHGGAKKEEYNTSSLQKVKLGIANLEKHIENVQLFGLKAVVAINYFPNDSEEEIAYVKEVCAQKGVEAIVSKGFSEGGKGTEELARAVVAIAQSGESHFSPLYSNEASIEEKITAVATKIYGASKVNYNSKAVSQLKQIKTLGFDKMPICIVKTPKSLSDDEKKLARPTDFEVTVREFEFASGAGFVIPILGDTVRMPGLPSVPAAEGMDIDDEGVITGLS
ncbi:formate--tetrahydrofolate ligase [Capnocytophaga sp. oral taxon 902]|uniref:Formate--tetrahydrofolate ligase n=1 Tax=Capnocytophaga ochracea TaxID=1018 RepID=A0AA46W6M4_CAPOC|nr:MULTISPECIES: formate--tetrahydrofolate ligase [Capnocytophaga]QLF49841.1 formate--tetrahydrofolate ligase [Capnocytophaga sp. oral taxon 902]UZD40356.1 formate--tetrahydrofolate ligase [Capnocytophaga ochracea]